MLAPVVRSMIHELTGLLFIAGGRRVPDNNGT